MNDPLIAGRWRTRIPVAFGFSVVIASAGCDWVDSTGRQPGEIQGISIQLGDTPIGGAVGVEESMRRPLIVSRGADSGTVFRWDDASIAEGALDSCAAIEGFTVDSAAGSLGEACASDEDDCRLLFEPIEGGDDFDLVTPTLRAAVGVRRALVVGRIVDPAGGEAAGGADQDEADQDESGGEVFVEERRQEYDFCLIAINEAPDPRNDTYVVVEGELREIGGGSGVLANDTDDEDVRNQGLRVSPIPVQGPSQAVEFELFEDGGFRYLAPGPGIGADLLDSFRYEVTDGLQARTATATIRIVTGNQAPTLIDEPPTLFATEGELFDADLARYFSDPEGARLVYSFAEALPDDGDLRLTSEGVLLGTPGSGDVGITVLTLVADDGGASSETFVTLIIEPAAVAEDQPPDYEAGSVFDQLVELGDKIDSVEPEFVDPEGERLRYRSRGTALPFGVALDTDKGKVSGRPRVRGTFAGVVIEARDPAGNATLSEPFTIRVR